MSKTKIINAIENARVRDWRYGNYSPYPGMLHDPTTDYLISWQDGVRRALQDVPEGARVTIKVEIDVPEPGTIHPEDYWTLASPHTYEHRHKQIQKECLETVDKWCRGSAFSWPMDQLASQSYTYDIHVAIVNAWNAEGRNTEIVEFHRAWLSDVSNIKAVLEKRG